MTAIPTVTTDADGAYKSFSNAGRALDEAKMTRALHRIYMPCIGMHTENSSYVLTFDYAIPLARFEASSALAKYVFDGLLSALTVMHTTFAVAHLSICPRHIVLHHGDVRIVDTSSLLPLGAPLRLHDGMMSGFTPIDAILGDQRVQPRHDLYSAAATALWVARRSESFKSHHEPAYKLGMAYINDNAIVSTVRTIWDLTDEEMYLFRHLVLGFQQAAIAKICMMIDRPKQSETKPGASHKRGHSCSGRRTRLKLR